MLATLHVFKLNVCFSLVKSTPIFNQEQSLQTSARLHSETNLDSNFKENRPLCNATNFLNRVVERDETALRSQKANLRIFLAQPSKSLVTNHMYGCEPQLTKMHINADSGQQMQMVEDSAAQWG